MQLSIGVFAKGHRVMASRLHTWLFSPVSEHAVFMLQLLIDVLAFILQTEAFQMEGFCVFRCLFFCWLILHVYLKCVAASWTS